MFLRHDEKCMSIVQSEVLTRFHPVWHNNSLYSLNNLLSRGFFKLFNKSQGLAVHSFEDLIKRLATLARATKEVSGIFYDEVVPPTGLQGKALEFLGVKNLL